MIPVLPKTKKWQIKELSLLFIVTILLGAVVAFKSTATHSAKASGPAPVFNQAQLQKMSQDSLKKLKVVGKLPTKVSKRAAMAPAALPAYNNVGASNDSNPKSANFDGGGNSYSFQALAGAHLNPNQSFIYDGVTFIWPNAGAGVANNYSANGQVLPVTPVNNATNLSFIGSSTNGPSTGTITITYTDNSTQQVSLGMSDWTLNGSRSLPSYGNQIVALMSYRNTPNGKQTKNIFMFYATVSVDPSKTIQSVTLPTSVNQGKLHIFAVGTRGVEDNIGRSNNNNPSAANFDGVGYSYPEQELEDQGLMPGTLYNISGITFPWLGNPALTGSAYVAQPDNIIASGQRLSVKPVPNANVISFFGAATNGPSFGSVDINYTDGSYQSFWLGFSDWTLNGLTRAPSYGNQLFVSTNDRNGANGMQKGVPAFIYYATFPLMQGETVESVTLPSSVNQGQLHIFSIGTGNQTVSNNVGVSNDYSSTSSGPLFTNFDGNGYSYSNQALKNAGIDLSTTFSFNRVNFQGLRQFPDWNPDNYQIFGQTIPVTPVPNATTLAFVGAASNGPAGDIVTMHFTDGNSQQFRLILSDWTLNGGKSQVYPGNQIVAKMSYRNNSSTGIQNKNTYLFYSDVAIFSGETVASVTITPLYNQGELHIFAIGTK